MICLILQANHTILCMTLSTILCIFSIFFCFFRYFFVFSARCMSDKKHPVFCIEIGSTAIYVVNLLIQFNFGRFYLFFAQFLLFSDLCGIIVRGSFRLAFFDLSAMSMMRYVSAQKRGGKILPPRFCAYVILFSTFYTA